ncbi:uncharacterized protein LOC114290296 [Camellia sinensis]|uniref:uncharacterized protein LOC114290296 n=1 Tax=Camellia sinensis TaxID=4442 RepID=UPI001036607D|nr:uncharacterized protein LOC114290296 [Camellia sinensis]
MLTTKNRREMATANGIIEHFRRKHRLNLREEPSSTARCAVCGQHGDEDEDDILGSLYRCTDGCKIAIHKSCSAIPPVLFCKPQQQPPVLICKKKQQQQEHHNHFHPQHPLFLAYFIPTECDACGHRIVSNFMAYICLELECSFNIHVTCSFLTPTSSKTIEAQAGDDNHHPHPLILCDPPPKIYTYYCSCCCQPFNEQTPVYVCLEECKALLHKSCAELPKKIKHPFHQIHPLTLRTKDDGSPLSCKACLMPCGRLIYHCSKCEHSLHIKYASPVRIVRSKIHHHSLAFVDFPYPRGSNPIGSFNHPDSNCRDCGGNFMTPEFCEDNFPMPKVYRCVDCNFNIHLKCIPTLPETVQNGHRHRLTITDSMVKDRPDEDEEDPTIVYYCDACEQRRRLVDRTYYCTECHFVSHVDCDSVASEVVKSLETESFLAKENTVTKKWTSKAVNILLLLFIFSLLLLSDSYRSKGRCLV